MKTMKRNTARNVSLGLLVLTMAFMACNKGENSATTEQQDSEETTTPVIVAEETAAASAVAATAKVKSPVPGYGISYPYGVKNPRYAAGYHTGDDYASPTGTKVVAVLD